VFILLSRQRDGLFAVEKGFPHEAYYKFKLTLKGGAVSFLKGFVVVPCAH